MNKNKIKYIILPFLIIIFGFLIINIVMPEKKYSIAENRNLEVMPRISDIKDNTFVSKFEKYFIDQFAFREEFIRINRKTEVKLNKSEVGNYYLGKNNWILGKFSKPLSEKKLNKYSNKLNELAEFSDSIGAQVYYVSTPHKTNMLKHLYPKTVDKKDSIDNNKNALKRNLEQDIISFIDLDEYFLNGFNDKEREKLYFKTDHHWNGIGAFEGFKFMAKSMQSEEYDEELDKYFSKYKTVTLKNKNFIGSYNRNLDMLVKEKEYPSYVYLKGAKYDFYLGYGKKYKKVNEEKVLATSRNNKEWDYGGAYTRGAQCNILRIKNKSAIIKKKALVFRDSYEAPMTWLLADLFSEVDIVDPRNISHINMNYKQIISNSKSDLVIFMYNSFGFDSMIEEMIKKDGTKH